jgi:TldD protein
MQSWVLEDGIIKDGNFNIEQGAGLRAIAGEKTGFAYSDELELPGPGAGRRGGARHRRRRPRGQCRARGAPPVKRLYEPLNPIDSLDDAAKVDLLHRVDAEARRADPRVTQVVTSLVAVQDTILVIADDGA